MANVALVAVIHRLQYLPDNHFGFVLLKTVPPDNLVQQVISVAKFCYEVEVTFVPEDFQEAHNMRMV